MSNFTVNFYEVLGVELNASMKEIKKQYSKLIRPPTSALAPI